MPAAQFPDQLDIRAVGQFAVIEFEGDFVRREILSNEIILVPLWRVVHLDFEMAERLPASGDNLPGLAVQRIAQKPAARRRVKAVLENFRSIPAKGPPNRATAAYPAVGKSVCGRGPRLRLAPSLAAGANTIETSP